MIAVAGPPGSGKTSCFPVTALTEKALGAFDQIEIYDSTERWVAPRLVMTARDGQIVRHGQQPQWLSAL